jgi:hypothetical protein
MRDELDRRKGPEPLSNSQASIPQYMRIVHARTESAWLDGPASRTHSMRRTKPARIYRKTDKLRAVQLLLGI